MQWKGQMDSAWISVLQMPTDLQTNHPKGELRQRTAAHSSLKRRQRLDLTTVPLFVQVSLEQLQRVLRIYSLHV